MNDEANYYFSITEAGSTHTFSKSLDSEDLMTWKAVLQDFLRFLDGAFGYDISGQVQFPPERPSQMELEGFREYLMKDEAFGNYGGNE